MFFCPLAGGLIEFLSAVNELVGNLGVKRFVGIRRVEQSSNGKQNCAKGQNWTPLVSQNVKRYGARRGGNVGVVHL